jgi:hypothetical protein
MGKIKYLIIMFMAAMALASCRKIQQLPPEPRIEFRSFQVFDTIDILGNSIKAGRLKFYFEDGDGNIGLTSEAVPGQDTTNLFFTLFRKNKGVFSQVPDDDIMKPSAYRIPYMDRQGQNKILKGTIAVTFMYFFYETADNDTVKYEFYLKDRLDNFSNITETSEIALSFNDVYMK